MKNLKILFLTLTFATATMTLPSCGSGSNQATAKEGKEYTSEYVCPMHCEGSGSAEEGKCPVCKMDYVKNEEHTADGHTH